MTLNSNVALSFMNRNVAIKTGHPEFDGLIPRIQAFLEKDALDIVIDGKRIRGYRSPDAKSIWIRDYSDMLRGVKYFEKDVKSAVDHFADTQADNGRIFDYFTTFPERLPGERENWTKYVRVPVEADVEYRFVKAAFLAWQATGDNDWIQGLLPRMEAAMGYVLTHPWRWEKKFGLVKRAYTIDSWDFAYTAGKHPWLQFQIDDDTFWGIMHGDNSGYYEAFQILALLNEYFNRPDEAGTWRRRAEALKKAMNQVCWNGRFYTHFVKLTPVDIPGVDESAQLSLSNPMDINRGVASPEMARSIIEEYRRRRNQTEAFAEWFSIDPPFPDGVFGDQKLKRGAYVNGGIMPLVGGELARAAFEHGYEKYGVDILRRYHHLFAEKGETYLWYFPDGQPASVETSTSPEAEPSDGWGSSAMLYALIEGLAGIEDKLKLYQTVRLSPRWAAAEVDEADVAVKYKASGATFQYHYKKKDDMISIEAGCREAEVQFHVMIPEDRQATSVTADGKIVRHNNVTVYQSHYVDFEASISHLVAIAIQLRRV